MSRITQGLLANEQELKMGKKMIKEAGSGEMYASKAAMKKHEAKESPAMEKAEHKMRGGGIAVKGKGIALRGGGIATRGMGVALKKGGMGRKGK